MTKTLEDLLQQLLVGMPEEDPYQKQLREDSAVSMKLIHDVVEKHKPIDIQTENIDNRLTTMALTLIPTRSTLLTTLVYSALYLPTVPIDKASVMKIFEEIYDGVTALKGATMMRERYEANLLKRSGAVVVEGSDVVN